MVFYNDNSLNIKMSEDFIKMWNDVQLPASARELERELEKVGQKSMEVMKAKPKANQAVEKKKARRNNRRAKITNTHILETLRQ